MTEREKQKALAYWPAFLSLRPRMLRHVPLMLMITLILGVLLVGFMTYVLSRFVRLSHGAQLIIAIVPSAAIGIWNGLSAYRCDRANELAMRRNHAEIESEVGKNQVIVYESSTAKSRYLAEENPEHPDLLVDFGDGQEVRISAMEQEELGIDQEFSGACRLVMLPTSRLIVDFEADLANNTTGGGRQIADGSPNPSVSELVPKKGDEVVRISTQHLKGPIRN